MAEGEVSDEEDGPFLAHLDVTGCPCSVITVLMLSILKVQYCDNWRMAAILTSVSCEEAFPIITLLIGFIIAISY